MTEIKYTCFATPPYDIKVEKVYSFGKDREGYFFEDVKCKKHLDIEEMKILFTPVDKTWDEVLKVKRTAKAQEDVESTVDEAVEK